jgi:O-antigen/teichoic acid export membrane protein
LTIVIPVVVNSLVFLITSRSLSPADFGVVALASTLAGGAASLVPSGFGDAIVQRQSLDAASLDSVFWLCVAAGLLIYALLVFVSAPLGGLFSSPEIAVLLPVIGLRVIIDTAGIVPTALVSRSMAFHLTALRSLAASFLAGMICVGLIAAGYGLWGLVASALASSLVATTTMCWTAGWAPRLRFDWASIKAMSSYGSYATGTKLISYIGGQGDQAVVGFALGTVDLGLYNFAKRLFSMIGDVTTGALTAVAHPFFAGIQDDVGRVRRGFMTATFLSSVIAFPCFVGLAAVSHNLILGLFGEKWLPAVWPTRVLCVWGLIYCIGVLQASLINSLGRAKWWFRYQLASNILNVPIVVLAAPHGVTTMLVVLAVKAYLIWCVPVWLTLKLLSMSASDYMRQFLAPLLAATAMGFAAILAPYAVHLGSPTALLALQIGAGAFTYALVLFGLARGRVVSLLDLFRGFRRPGVTAP